MVSIPVLNTPSPTQVLSVLNLFPAPGSLLPSDDTFDDLAYGFAIEIETYLNERCRRYANRLAIELRRIAEPTRPSLCTAVAKLVHDAVPCDLVAVFLEKPDGQALECGACAPRRLSADVVPAVCAGPAAYSWRSNRSLTSLNLREEPAFTLDAPQTVGPVLPGAFVPLRDLAGQAKGVIGCVNSCTYATHGDLRPFTFDDLALVEAIGEAFVPRLEVLLAEQQRIDSFNKLAHELRVPVTAFRAVSERIEHECKHEGYTFCFDYFRELRLYQDVMARLLRELDCVRFGAAQIQIRSRGTRLLRDIIAPAKRFITSLLRQRGFRTDQIAYVNVEQIPVLYLDPALMTQVVFNLMENAIKYYQGAADSFRLVIEGRSLQDAYEMAFRDNGVGLETETEATIFEAGTRGRNAFKYHVAGEGLGLWLSRTIVQRHGGDLVVRSHRQPTEFVIILPHDLAISPPPEEETEE